jgi:hypothetical protein
MSADSGAQYGCIFLYCSFTVDLERRIFVLHRGLSGRQLATVSVPTMQLSVDRIIS